LRLFHSYGIYLFLPSFSPFLLLFFSIFPSIFLFSFIPLFLFLFISYCILFTFTCILPDFSPLFTFFAFSLSNLFPLPFLSVSLSCYNHISFFASSSGLQTGTFFYSD
jgi:hypothetical protein